MTELVVLLVLVAIVVYGIERNNARNRYPRSQLSGSTAATDRDAERLSADTRWFDDVAPGTGKIGSGRP